MSEARKEKLHLGIKAMLLNKAELKQKMHSAPLDPDDIENALDDSDYDEENYDAFRDPNGLHDYKER